MGKAAQQSDEGKALSYGLCTQGSLSLSREYFSCSCEFLRSQFGGSWSMSSGFSWKAELMLLNGKTWIIFVEVGNEDVVGK